MESSEDAVFDVELRGVSRVLSGRRIIDNLTLKIHRGKFFTLLGPSGCGKTTLLRLIAGFDGPDSGTVWLGGLDVTGVPVHKRDLNLVFQNYALFPHMNVGKNIAFGLRMQNVKHHKSLVAAALERVRLPGYENREPSTLSGGEQQRVALARAIITNPRVLLLDEPLGALDLKLRRGLQEELRRLQRELAMTFVYVTHDQEEALSMSDCVAVMNNGVIEQIATPREIYDHPASRYVAGFVGTANFIEENGKVRVVRPERMKLGSNGLEAVVEGVFFHGATTRVVACAGTKRYVIDENGTLVNIGDCVHISWKPEDEQVVSP